MDPNANLKEQREIAHRLLHGSGDNTRYTAIDRRADARRLSELVQTLDQWIINGGFMPATWQQPRPRN